MIQHAVVYVLSGLEEYTGNIGEHISVSLWYAAS